MGKNLILTGMMGVGKSTIGRNLAKKLGVNFIDIDKIIEEREDLSINEIFNKKGESYFRKIESKITLKELRKKNSVIALGGGSFLNKFIRKSIKTNSVSFWLDLNIDNLVMRLRNSKKRPLLLQKNLRETINRIYLTRRKIYSEADHRIRCDKKKLEQIINKILRIYESSRN